MRDLRAYAFTLTGIIFGLVWSGGCEGGCNEHLAPLSLHARLVRPPQTPPAPPLALLTYDVPDGTFGGANTAGTWTTRPLNTIVYDPTGLTSLNSNQFTLGAGTYTIEANQIIFDNVDIQKSFSGRIRNITAGTTLAHSLSVRMHQGPSESASIGCPIPKTLFTLSGPATLELQYFCQSADASTWALGFPMPAPTTTEGERYAYVAIERLN